MARRYSELRVVQLELTKCFTEVCELQSVMDQVIWECSGILAEEQSMVRMVGT